MASVNLYPGSLALHSHLCQYILWTGDHDVSPDEDVMDKPWSFCSIKNKHVSVVLASLVLTHFSIKVFQNAVFEVFVVCSHPHLVYVSMSPAAGRN
jgi:hypothetical protein